LHDSVQNDYTTDDQTKVILSMKVMSMMSFDC